jgi:hypothetical protein
MGFFDRFKNKELAKKEEEKKAKEAELRARPEFQKFADREHLKILKEKERARIRALYGGTQKSPLQGVPFAGMFNTMAGAAQKEFGEPAKKQSKAGGEGFINPFPEAPDWMRKKKEG